MPNKDERVWELKVPKQQLAYKELIQKNVQIEQFVHPVDIKIQSIEEEFIESGIQDADIKRKLQDKSHLLIGEKNLVFYTDGSWLNPEEQINEAKMGAGWIVFKEKDSEKQLITDFSCALTNWPSSTKAELGAIATALFAMPTNAKVTIIMDSVAAIQAIKRSQEIYKLREGLKIKNRSIL